MNLAKSIGMKDDVLIFKDKKTMQKDYQEVRRKIDPKYWFGWAGGYNDSKKKNQ